MLVIQPAAERWPVLFYNCIAEHVIQCYTPQFTIFIISCAITILKTCNSYYTQVLHLHYQLYYIDNSNCIAVTRDTVIHLYLTFTFRIYA